MYTAALQFPPLCYYILRLVLQVFRVPTIISNASMELPVRCVSEEILWLANQ